MPRSTILPLAAAVALATGAAIATAAAQTTTTTTTTTTRDGTTTVTRETTVLGEPTAPAPTGTVTTAPATGTTGGLPGERSMIGEPGTMPPAGTGSTVRTLGTVTMPAPGTPATGTTTAAPSATMAPTAAPAMGPGQLDISDPIETRNGLRYACTGIGLDARQDPRWKDFSIKLMFTVDGGGYLPDVLTQITDSQGRQVFAERCDGPWLLVDLPAGRYKVVASAQDPNGQVHEHTANISAPSSGQRQEVIRFPEMPS